LENPAGRFSDPFGSVAINGEDQRVGRITGLDRFNGVNHAFILDPITIPEPASVWLVGLGFRAAALRRRRR
jgi:hypothetical protein